MIYQPSSDSICIIKENWGFCGTPNAGRAEGWQDPDSYLYRQPQKLALFISIVFFHRNTCEQMRFDSHNFLPHEELLWVFPYETFSTFCFQIQKAKCYPKSHAIQVLCPQKTLFNDFLPRFMQINTCAQARFRTWTLWKEKHILRLYSSRASGTGFRSGARYKQKKSSLYWHRFKFQTHEEILKNHGSDLTSKDICHIRMRYCVTFSRSFTTKHDQECENSEL